MKPILSTGNNNTAFLGMQFDKSLLELPTEKYYNTFKGKMYPVCLGSRMHEGLATNWEAK